MIRRAVAAAIAVVIVVLIVLLINGCLKSEKQSSLKSYNQDVSNIAKESQEQVSDPLFAALASAHSKSALDVEEAVAQMRYKAQEIASHAQSLSVPGEMEGAQRDLLLALNLRAEALNKLAALLPTALGAKSSSKSTAQIAGAMESFLASDVIYSQRVVPLLQQTLSANGITGLTTAPTRFLPNIGWLEESTVASRLMGGQSTASTTTAQEGHHGSVLSGVSVGGNTLAAEPTLNHLSGGSSPTFTVQVENDGEFPETDVKAQVTVTAGGKQYKGTGTIEKTEPGKTADAEVKVSEVPTGAAAKVEAEVEPVPGETNHEDTKQSYLAIFE